jgi:hypothetical protein
VAPQGSKRCGRLLWWSWSAARCGAGSGGGKIDAAGETQLDTEEERLGSQIRQAIATRKKKAALYGEEESSRSRERRKQYGEEETRPMGCINVSGKRCNFFFIYDEIETKPMVTAR